MFWNNQQISCRVVPVPSAGEENFISLQWHGGVFNLLPIEYNSSIIGIEQESLYFGTIQKVFSDIQKKNRTSFCGI